MADVDIDPFGEHDKTDTHPDETGENPGGATWEPEPEHEQETSFGGKLMKAKFLKKNKLKNCTII